MSGLAVANCAGRSSYGTDTLAKTLGPAGTTPTWGARTAGSTRSPRTGDSAAISFSGMATQDADAAGR